MPETAATTATVTVLGPTHQHRPAATRGFRAPRVVLKSPYSQTGPVDKPRGLSMGPLGELPRVFCCNSAISRSLLIGIRRFLVQTWIEFQGGSNGELKMTPKPQADPLFRGFRFFARSMAQDRHSLGLHLQQTPAKWRFPGEKRAARWRKTRQTTQTTRVPAQTYQA